MGQKKAIFLPKIGFLPCRGLATTPPPYFEGAQYKKTRLRNEQVHTDQFLEPVFAKICHFLSKMCQNLPFFGPKQVFSPWRGLPRPPPLFQGCPMQQKRVTGAKECTWTSFGSLSPPKCHIFRQKSAKINFGMSLLHKIIGVAHGMFDKEIHGCTPIFMGHVDIIGEGISMRPIGDPSGGIVRKWFQSFVY